MGLWRGKKGSTVFYYNKNSSTAMKQAMRERVYEISNPKTRTQATQRMKVTPMQRVGTALGEILRRSWQGIEYGGKGLQEFRKLALKMTSGYPYVDKGEPRAIPGTYQISRGSLVPVRYVMENDKLVFGNIFSGTPTVNIGYISQKLMDEFGAHLGDQCTIVFCIRMPKNSTAFESQYTWGFGSFLLDTESTQAVNDVIPQITVTAQIIGGQEKQLAVMPANTQITKIAAGAIIMSRLNGSTYERSNASLVVNTDLAPWFTEERKRVARLTYQDTTRATTMNWEVDPDEATSPGLYTISGSSISSLNGTKIWVRYSDDTGSVSGVYVTQESGGAGGTPPYVLGENGTQVFYTSGSNENAANPTDCGLGDVPTITWTGIPTD